jgi:uncharacterized membrane protein
VLYFTAPPFFCATASVPAGVTPVQGSCMPLRGALLEIFGFCCDFAEIVVYYPKFSLEEAMLTKYLTVFFVSMVPLIELRGGIVMAMGMDLPYWPSLAVCVLGNMLPVPIIYFFARKVLIWGAHRKYIGKAFTFFLEKGHAAGAKLRKSAGRGGLFFALMLFVGIPLPGTGAWTGTLGASFLDMGIKSTAVAVSLGVILAGGIMGLASMGIFNMIGL